MTKTWQETVIKGRQDWITKLLEQQAEISFKAGEKSGYDQGVEDRLGLEDAQTQTIKQLRAVVALHNKCQLHKMSVGCTKTPDNLDRLCTISVSCTKTPESAQKVRRLSYTKSPDSDSNKVAHSISKSITGWSDCQLGLNFDCLNCRLYGYCDKHLP